MTKTRLVEPYRHECPGCTWVGWVALGGDRLGNVYVCRSTAGGEVTVVIRFGDEPGDYWSKTEGGEKGAISVWVGAGKKDDRLS